MTLPRRTFLKTSLAATAALSGGLSLQADEKKSMPTRACYDLRCYRLAADTRLKSAAPAEPIERYLEGAILPALDKRGIRNVGVFSELVVDGKAGTASPKADSPLWVLITYPDAATYVDVTASLNSDPTVQESARDYFNLPKSSPPFERLDAWLYRAFAGMPQPEIPEFSRQRAPDRVFEMRAYESYSEAKALGKMAMFDEGEIQLMRDLGMSPVFYGQALAGPDLPHLRYITSGRDLASHLDGWKRFGSDPRWLAIRDLPRFADTVSKNTALFLAPRPYSAI